MQSLDSLGNPIPIEVDYFECPETMVCLTEDSFNEMLEPYEMEYSAETLQLEPMGDAEAVLDFTTTLLFLDFWTIAYLAIPLTIFAVYGYMQVSNGYRKNFPKYLTNIRKTVIMTISYETYDQMVENISRNQYIP